MDHLSDIYTTTDTEIQTAKKIPVNLDNNRAVKPCSHRKINFYIDDLAEQLQTIAKTTGIRHAQCIKIPLPYI